MPVFCMRALQVLSLDSAYTVHMPQTNRYEHRHLVDNPALVASISRPEIQIQLFLPTILSQAELSGPEVFLL